MDSINTLDPQPNILVGLTVEQLLNVSLRQVYTLELFRSLNETALQAQTLCCFTKQGDPWVLLSIQKYFLYLTYTSIVVIQTDKSLSTVSYSTHFKVTLVSSFWLNCVVNYYVSFWIINYFYSMIDQTVQR